MDVINTSKHDEKLALLEDTRARVIYYSCMAEPKNILEIARLWGYKTSTYFYQQKSREIIDKIVSNKLVSILKGARFQSNYSLLLEKKGAKEFFERTNKKISNEIIVEKYDWEVTESQLEDSLFREFCIEKKPELKQILDGVAITGREIDSFLSLWEAPLFGQIFLSADVITKLIGDRKELPQDPRELLFSITTNTCERFYHYKETGMSEFPDPFLWLDIGEVFPSIYTKLKSATENSAVQSKALHQRFKEVYKTLKKKFAIHAGRSEIGAYHVAKIVKIMGL